MIENNNEELARSVEAEDKAMLDMVTRADAGEEITPLFESDTSGTRSPESKPASEELDPSKTPEQIQKGDPKKVEAGKDSKTVDATGKDSVPPKEEQKGTKYEQAKREKERQDRSWKALNEQKEAIRLEKEAIAKEKAAYDDRIKAMEKKLAETQAKSSTTEISAKEYEEAAKDYREDAKRLEERGQFEEADKLLKKARLCERNASEKRNFEKSTEENQKKISQEAEVEKFHKAWDENLEKLKKSDEYKELADPKSPLGLETSRLIRDNPMLSQYPQGITDAAMIARWKMTAESLPAVQSKLAEVEKKYAELAGKLRLGASGNPELPKGTKDFHEMSEDEMGSHLANEAAALDNR